MKSNIYFTKYLLSTLLNCKEPTNNFFLLMSELKEQDLEELIYIRVKDKITLLCKTLYKVLYRTFKEDTTATGTFYQWKDLNTDRIVEIIVNNTYIKDTCTPLYYFTLKRADYKVFTILQDDIIKSMIDLIRSYTINTLRRTGLAESFNAVNKAYYWRKIKTYR